MIQQGTLDMTEHAVSIKTEKVVSGQFTDLIHLHLKRDSILKEHIAKTNAVLLVLDGEIDYIEKDKRYRLRKGDYLTFEANLVHSLEAFEDSHLILMK